MQEKLYLATEAPAFSGGEGLGSDDDDARVGEIRVRTDGLHNLKSVDLWHHEVEQDEVGTMAADQVDPLPPIVCFKNLIVASGLQHAAQ